MQRVLVEFFAIYIFYFFEGRGADVGKEEERLIRCLAEYPIFSTIL